MSIFINSIVAFTGAARKIHLERVLYISSNGDDIVTIRLPDYMVPENLNTQDALLDDLSVADDDDTNQLDSDATDALVKSKSRKPSNPVVPEWRKRFIVDAAIADGSATILDDDPYFQYMLPDEALSISAKSLRERGFKVIAPLVARKPGESQQEHMTRLLTLFSDATRGSAVARRAAEMGITRQQVYKYLRRWFQGGQSINALLPHFLRCGAPGKERFALPSGPNLGRKSRLLTANFLIAERFTSDDADNSTQVIAPARQTVKLTPKIKEQFRRAIKLSRVKHVKDLERVYRDLLIDHYLDYDEKRDGQLSIVLKSERPSLRQLEYFHQVESNLELDLKAKFGERAFNRRHRPILGNSAWMGFGPGSLYQVDATVGDIYLVSSRDPLRIIGRPVIYVVIDVFSRLIVGMAVILEGPSWLGMSLALENMAANKVEYCRNLGITINEHEWPSHHLPAEILGDRGELISKNSDALTKVLSIDVGNAASYRCDWKGIVERRFRILNDTVIKWLPGHVDKEWARGDRDYRLDATLTLPEFRRIITRCVLLHNNKTQMPWYKMNEFAITDHVDRYPLDLWQWGTKNRSGSLRTKAQNIVLRSLLPKASARVTGEGIVYGGLSYGCDYALAREWFTKARASGTWLVPIAYDPRTVEHIFLCLENGDFIPCNLLDRDRNARKLDWYEQSDYRVVESIMTNVRGESDLVAQIEFEASTDETLKTGHDRKMAAHKAAGRVTKSAQIANIQGNRAEERDADRAAQVESSLEGRTRTSRSPHLDVGGDDDHVAPVTNIGEWERIRKEKMQNRGED